MKKRCIAIIGVQGAIGRHLHQGLLRDKDIGRVVAIDKIDITDDGSVGKIARTLKKTCADTLIYLPAPPRYPLGEDELHEFNVSGTMHVLLAVETAAVKKLILISTTEVYGAHPDNPGSLKEDYPLRGEKHSGFIKDKIDIENQFARFQRRFPQKVVTILRPCTIVGRNGIYSMTGSIVKSETALLTVLGFDPLYQFVHIKDVVMAVKIAVKKDFAGVFNIVGDGVIPLSKAMKAAERVTIPISSTLLYIVASVLWHLNIGSAPPAHINYLKYSLIADGSKARKIMGFKPMYSSMSAILKCAQTLKLTTFKSSQKATTPSSNLTRGRYG